ncbi:MAG: isoprenyl transferase [Alphaproteobacteria bacterium]|nr:isoprenyl transferase [Alphaproteobacteria bacterium]
MPSSDFQIPKHVAIIMDGNGRWATRRALPRAAGHKQGAETSRRIVKDAAELGIEYLTLFGFSSENWHRPEAEIQELMKLLRFYLRSETAELHKNGACLKVIGQREGLDDDIVQLIENAEHLTKDNDKITLVIALNYGGRQDIVQAALKFSKVCNKQDVCVDLKDMESLFSGFLMTAGIPDPDLLIRTSGEQRISNFLLWQCAYAELIFTKTLWPDFSREDLEKALLEYAGRDRRFGALKAL